MVLLKNLVLIAGIASLTECTPYSKREADPSPEAYAVADPDAYAEAFPEPYLPFSETSLAVRDPNLLQSVGNLAQGVGNFLSKAHPFEGMGHALEACFKQKLDAERTKARRDVSIFPGNIARRGAAKQGSITTPPGSPTAQTSANKQGGFRQRFGQIVKGVGDVMSKPGSLERLEYGIEDCVKQQIQERAKARRDISTILANISRRDAPAPGPAVAAPNSDPGSTLGSASPSGQSPATSPSSATPTPSPSTPKSDGLIQENRNRTQQIEKFLSNPNSSAVFTELLKEFEPELKRLLESLFKVFKFTLPFKRDAYANPFPEAYPEIYSTLYARDVEPDSEIYDIFSRDAEPDPEYYDGIFARDAFAEADAEAESESEPEPYEAGLYDRDAEAYPMPPSWMRGNGRPSFDFQGLMPSPFGGPHF